MMHRTALLAGIAALALGGCHRRDVPLGGILEVHDATVRATTDTTHVTTAGYLRLVNVTDDSVIVRHITSNVSTKTEVHRSWIDSTGAAHMAMDSTIRLGPHGTLVMRPGGVHLMLIDTVQPLTPGDHVRFVMTLSNGAIVSTMARVR
jgi:copper(I)-binding protein